MCFRHHLKALRKGRQMESIVEINAFDQEVNKWKTDLTLATKPNVIYALKWSEVKVAQSCPTLCDPMDSPWNSPSLNTGVGSLSFLWGIFPTQGSNPGLLHRRRILYQLSHKGSPRILEWVAFPFSRGSSQPRNQTGVSCIAGRFFTNWAIREAWGSLPAKDFHELTLRQMTVVALSGGWVTWL